MATERKKQQDRERMQRKRAVQLERIEELTVALSYCHEIMHQTIAVLSFSDSQKVAGAMRLARNALGPDAGSIGRIISSMANVE